MSAVELAPVRAFLNTLVALGLDADATHRALDLTLDGLSITELAALAYDWSEWWSRPNQRLDGSAKGWRTHGYLTARRFGKTRSLCEFVNAEAEAGRAMRIGFCAQNWDKTIEVMVHGDAGYLATSPPWFKARWESGRVVWPNGAQAFPFTPEVPGSFRGPGLNLFHASEIQSWPASTADEAFSNATLMTSSGYARLVWDATPKKGHKILRALIAAAEAHPDIHRIIRGTIDENSDNLGAGVIDSLKQRIGGTRRGREELLGEMIEDDDDALWKQKWIDAHRRPLPAVWRRRIVVLDPAISERKGTDETGISRQGLAAEDGQVIIVADHTRRYEWTEWGKVTHHYYFADKCDCVVVERNAGGDSLVANLRSTAPPGVVVRVVDKSARTRHEGGVMYVKEVFSRQSKQGRAGPVATEAEAGRVSHAIGGEGLEKLEDELTSWAPGSGARSPNALDAMVLGVWELRPDLSDEPGADQTGIAERVRAGRAAAPSPVADVLSAMVARGGRGRGGGRGGGGGGRTL